jgi:transposase-like protein
MKRTAYSPEQIVKLLRGVEATLAAGKSAEEACREVGVADSSCHRRRNQYGGMQTDEATRLQEPERENERLNRIVADLSLGKAILEEAARGT